MRPRANRGWVRAYRGWLRLPRRILRNLRGVRRTSYRSLRKARPAAAAALDELVHDDSGRADLINHVLLEEFDDRSLRALVRAVSLGNLEIVWDEDNETPMFHLTEKYWRDYDRLTFGP